MGGLIEKIKIGLNFLKFKAFLFHYELKFFYQIVIVQNDGSVYFEVFTSLAVAAECNQPNG